MTKKIDDLIAAYENLPIGFGEKVMGEVCKFVNENRKGFEEVKLLHEENKRLRDALGDAMQWISAFSQGQGERDTVQKSDRYLRYKQALGDKRGE